MKACVLYSGGKDSSLMAFILNKLGYDVELVTVNYGIYPSWKPAAESASNLNFNHRVMKADSDTMRSAVQTILSDGFPNNGINQLHKYALELVAKEYDVVADGTRRDDRIPKLNMNEVRSFEDRNNVEYINLGGFGHKSMNHLSNTLFEVKKELTNMDNNSDYEIEIRYLISEIEGDSAALKIFPEHLQSRVIGWRKNE
jgi:tRNA methyltransferase